MMFIGRLLLTLSLLSSYLTSSSIEALHSDDVQSAESNQECNSETVGQCVESPELMKQEEEVLQIKYGKLFLAGFKPDGYLSRAKTRLEELKKYVESEVKEFDNKKDYMTWKNSFLLNKFNNSVKTDSSTLLWLENPVQYFGDSNDLESFVTTCTSKETCNPRKTSDAGKEQVTGWEHEAHQAVKCESSTGSFYIILLRDWNHGAFTSFLEGITNLDSFPYSLVLGDSHILFRLDVVPTENTSNTSRNLERGTILANGTHVRVNIQQEQHGQLNPKFVSFGYVPEGDLKRTVKYWSKREEIHITSCKLMSGGLRRVQSILALDSFSVQ